MIILCLIQLLLLTLGIINPIVAHVPHGVPAQERAIDTHAKPDVKPETQKHIRVLLTEYPCDSFKTLDFTLASSQELLIRHPYNNATVNTHTPKKFTISYKKGHFQLILNAKEKINISELSLEISSRNNIVSLNGSRYNGNIIIRKYHNSIMVINKLEIEDYISSVIRSEISPSWHAWMQELHSIISRSYAVSLMVEARSKGWVYDIKNTNIHQVYNGFHHYNHLRDAVYSTKGKILMYHGNVARTMFDTCCGGVTPGNIRNQDKYSPYVFRKNRCTFCKNHKEYSWKCDLYLPSFIAQLKKSNKKVAQRIALLRGTVTNVTIIDKDKAGKVYKIALIGSRKKQITIAYNELNAAIHGKLKSRVFSIKIINDRIVFMGNGTGHLCGLCQIGAMEQLLKKEREGKKKDVAIKETLAFYYPDTKIGHLI
jgi:SpoIID/LytB domain protein